MGYLCNQLGEMAWFYRGGGKRPVAHWFDPTAEDSLCTRLKPDRRGVALRHPQHDRHIPKCTHCEMKLATRTIPPESGVKAEGGHAP
jgi:hypothetical protein